MREDRESDVPQGSLARDHEDWVKSRQMVENLQKVNLQCAILGVCRRLTAIFQGTKAHMVLGHNCDFFFSCKHAPHAYT